MFIRKINQIKNGQYQEKDGEIVDRDTNGRTKDFTIRRNQTEKWTRSRKIWGTTKVHFELSKKFIIRVGKGTSRRNLHVMKLCSFTQTGQTHNTPTKYSKNNSLICSITILCD